MSENKNYSGQSVSDSDLLISGLQHFSFGRRQWALIHIESQWAENYLTVDGKLRHDNADDPYFTEKRGDLLISRAIQVRSGALVLPKRAEPAENFTTRGSTR